MSCLEDDDCPHLEVDRAGDCKYCGEQCAPPLLKWPEKALNRLHPECRIAWDRGLTDYPPAEHIRDCDDCLALPTQGSSE